jgi:cytochrome c oxidase subunit 2
VLWWTADRPGIYYGQCTQLCGTSHANMRLRAVAHDPAGWQAWVDATRSASGTPAEGTAGPIARGHQLVTTGACTGCHTIQGTPMQAKVGPDLTRFGERTTLGAGMYPNTQENLIRWLKNPQEAKPGNKMPNLGLSDEDAAAIAAYLRSLR